VKLSSSKYYGWYTDAVAILYKHDIKTERWNIFLFYEEFD